MRKRTYVLWKKILTWFFVSLATILFFYIYLGTNLVTIYNYDIIGAPTESNEAIQKDLIEISSHPLYNIIPVNKIFTYRGIKIKAAIKARLPNTSNITIGVVPLHTLRITITPYTPAFKLDSKRAITKEGYVYEETKNLDDLPFINVGSTTLKTTNKDGLEENRLIIDDATNTEILFNGITNIIPKINSVLFKVGKIDVNGDGDIILFDESEKSSVRLSTMIDIDKEWSNVISAIDTEPLKTLLETKKNKLEYIDVRFGNKVFYKFTNGLTPDIIHDTNATSTATTTTR